MSAPRRIPVTLVTGFLGSGKTSFINAALRAPAMAKSVVVVNEFGEVGLDHQLVAQSSDSVMVLENGCLCCTVRSDLVGTLNALYHDREAGRIPRFDNVVIESSGLAEPGPVLQAFLSEPTLDGLYRVAGVVTLVDAVNWPETLRRHDEAIRQVAFADHVFLTKLDLVAGDAGEAQAALRREIAAINPTAEVAVVDWAPEAIAALLTAPGFDPADPQADPRPWLNAAAHESLHDHAGHDHDGHEHCAHDHDHAAHGHLHGRGIESFVLTRDTPLSREELRFLLDGIAQNLGPGLLRVKGLVDIADEPGRPAVIQGAQHLLHTMTWLEKWPDADRRTRIVFIVQGMAAAELKEMIELLDRVGARTFRARERARTRDDG